MAGHQNLFLVTSIIILISGAYTCPDYWMSFKGSCYVLIKNTSPWAYADEMCRDMNGYLVEINSPEENAFLKSHIKNSGENGIGYWTGGNDLLSEGDWMWIRSMGFFEFTDWAPGNPSNSNGNENCVELMRTGGTFQWNDKDCKVPQDFICEQDLETGAIIG